MEAMLTSQLRDMAVRDGSEELSRLRRRRRPNHLVVAEPSDTLSECVDAMALHGVASLPVIATEDVDQNVLYVLTARRIVQFLTSSIPDIARILDVRSCHQTNLANPD